MWGETSRALHQPGDRDAGTRDTPREQGTQASARVQRDCAGLLPSFSIPTLRHFMKRQAWQDLRLRFVISHSLVAGQLYSMFPVTRHTRGCGRRPGPSRPSTGRPGINRPDLQLPLVPRFPQGRGSQSRCSEALVKIFLPSFNTEIPESWGSGWAWQPQLGGMVTPSSEGTPELAFYPRQRTCPCADQDVGADQPSPTASSPRSPVRGKALWEF